MRYIMEQKVFSFGDKFAIRNKIVKSDGSDDLVFQSLRKGAPMHDNNILSRHIKPTARQLGFVNCRSLRTSRATRMIEAGANPKDVQGQMRHSRIQTTLDITPSLYRTHSGERFSRRQRW